MKDMIDLINEIDTKMEELDEILLRNNFWHLDEYREILWKFKNLLKD